MQIYFAISLHILQLMKYICYRVSERFHKKYANIKKLRIFFLDTSIIVLLATIMYNIPEYMSESLYL